MDNKMKFVHLLLIYRLKYEIVVWRATICIESRKVTLFSLSSSKLHNHAHKKHTPP